MRAWLISSMDTGSIAQDIHDAGLTLGLAIGPAGGTASGADAGIQHRRRGEDSPSPRRPPLTLSLSGDGGLPEQKAEGSLSTSAVKKEKDSEEGERVSSRGSDEEEDSGGGRKKLRLTKEQSAFLEDRFKEHSTLNPRQKQALAKQLNLRPRQVEVWFQNRRARTKLKQTEVDCELLKRCYQTLTTENQRLQKELQELKALRLVPPPSSPQPPPSPVLYMQFPAATLAMCPSCERMGGGGAPTDGRPQLAGAAAGGPVSAPQKAGHFFKRPFTHSAAC